MADLPNPKNRKELYLYDAATGRTGDLPSPKTREELYLNEIAENSGGGGGGTTNYNQLSNKPQINSVELSGNKTTEDLIPVGDGLDFDENGNLIATGGGSGAVDSVNGKTGVVVLDAEDVGAYSTSEVDTALANKVDKVTGKGLSTNDYTDVDKAEVAKVTNKANSEDVIDGAEFDSTNQLILFKKGNTTLFSLSAVAFVKDGMVDTVSISDGNLVITFNTDAGKQNISIPLTDIFDPTNYYNKTATDNLLADKADETEIADIVNVYGAKNLIPYPYLNKSGTVFRGVTYTVNADGSVTANGTATGGDSAFFAMQRNVDNDFLSKIGQGSFILSGCPSGGSVQTYCINFNYGDAQSSVGNLGQDTGNGTEITIDTDITQYNAQIAVLIREGVTVSNLTFYPMLRMASVKDDTYVSYVPTNKEAVSWKGNARVGAKNLLSYPYYNTTRTISGITFTDNGDGTITANGTATEIVNYHLHSRDVGETNDFIIKNGTYIVTGTPIVQNNYGIGIDVTKNGTGVNLGTEYGNGITITCDGSDNTPSGYSNVQVRIFAREGTTLDNVIFKPMIRVVEDTDDTWQPYAMTNKELTDKLIPSIVSVNRDTTTTNSATIRLYRYGNLRILTGTFNPSVVGTSVPNAHIADLPLATDRPTYSTISTCGRGETDSSATAKIGNVNVGIDGTIKYQGQATGENMFFNVSWLVGI